MHKLNEEAYSNPEQWQRRATAAMTARRAEQRDPTERVSATAAECSNHDASDRISSNHPSSSGFFVWKNIYRNQFLSRSFKKIHEV